MLVCGRTIVDNAQVIVLDKVFDLPATKVGFISAPRVAMSVEIASYYCVSGFD
jgi:hypothetical protein